MHSRQGLTSTLFFFLSDLQSDGQHAILHQTPAFPGPSHNRVCLVRYVTLMIILCRIGLQTCYFLFNIKPLMPPSPVINLALLMAVELIKRPNETRFDELCESPNQTCWEVKALEGLSWILSSIRTSSFQFCRPLPLFIRLPYP